MELIVNEYGEALVYIIVGVLAMTAYGAVFAMLQWRCDLETIIREYGKVLIASVASSVVIALLIIAIKNI